MVKISTKTLAASLVIASIVGLSGCIGAQNLAGAVDAPTTTFSMTVVEHEQAESAAAARIHLDAVHMSKAEMPNLGGLLDDIRATIASSDAEAESPVGARASLDVDLDTAAGEVKKLVSKIKAHGSMPESDAEPLRIQLERSVLELDLGSLTVFSA